MGAAKTPEDIEKSHESRLLQLSPMSGLDAALMAQRKGRPLPPGEDEPAKSRNARAPSKSRKVSRADKANAERKSQADKNAALEKIVVSLRLKLSEAKSALASAIDREREHMLLIENLRREKRSLLHARIDPTSP